jgi:Ras-related protein Rab-11A
MEGDKIDLIIKIVTVGESSVGKTNLLLRFMRNEFDQAQRPTIGMDFFTKELTDDEYSIKVQFWDTAGQEKYKSLASAYYKVSNGVILVYDVTQRHTFERLEHWLAEIRANSPTKLKMMLIGNKTDIEIDRQVSSDEGKEFAMKNDMFFWETSAKTNSGSFVHKAFEEIIDECKKMILAMEQADFSRELENVRKKTVTLKKAPKRKEGCC